MLDRPGAAQILLQRLRKLGADQMAKGIGGKVAKQSLKSVPADLQVA